MCPLADAFLHRAARAERDDRLISSPFIFAPSLEPFGRPNCREAFANANIFMQYIKIIAAVELYTARTMLA